MPLSIQATKYVHSLCHVQDLKSKEGNSYKAIQLKISCYWWLFSAPELKAQVHYCDHTLSVVRLLYQVFVFRADRKNKMAAIASDWLRHIRLLLWNRWTEFNETWQEATSQRPLPSFSVFQADWKSKMAALASDWLRHFRLLLWIRWTEFNETWQEARSQCPLPSLCFSGRSEKQDGYHCLWLAETFSISPLKPLNGIQWNLTGSKISTSSTKFLFFRAYWKTRWLPWPLIGWHIFYFSPERNSTQLDRKQDLKVLYQVFFFGPIGKVRWPPWLLIGWHIFVFHSETAERNSMKLDRKQDLVVLYQVCIFRADQ